jgi:hypothetical protein
VGKFSWDGGWGSLVMLLPERKDSLPKLLA